MKWSLYLLFIFFSLSSYSVEDNENNQLENFYKNYKTGKYELAIKSLVNSEIPHFDFLKAITYSKLGEFDKALISFDLELKKGDLTEDFYYEFGQALYANNKLRHARSAFSKSAEKKFNVLQSKYYVAHISQILEEFNLAKNFYLEISNSKDGDPKIIQVSKFQLGEVNLSTIKTEDSKINDKTKGLVEKLVLMAFKKALDSDPSSTVANDIRKRTLEVQKEYDLNPNSMKNGRQLNDKRLQAYVNLKSKFDNNVTNSTEENNVTATLLSSLYQELESDIKYDFSFARRFIISPEFRINFIRYFKQSEPEVYENDSMIIYGALKNKYEHLFKGKMASLIYDLDYSKTYKDYNQIHKRSFYADAYTLTLGEQLSYFNVGDSTFKFKYKKYNSYSDSLSNNTIILSADQNIAFLKRHLLIFLLEADLVNNYNSTSTSTNSYIFRTDYIFPDFIDTYTLALSLNLTLVDTLESIASRGYETTITPSIEFSKQINEKFKTTLNFEKTTNNSKSSTYKYKKNVYGLELKYSF
jgi:hypothetical protein